MDGTAVRQDEIGKLITDLGNDRWKVREAATQRLREIGWPAVPALREAVKSPDLEVKCRAKSLLTAICFIAPAELNERRTAVQKGFRAADYAAAIRVAHKLTSYENAEMLDWLWCGHVCQLGSQWADAVRVYRKVVEFIDADIRDGVKEAPAGNRPAAMGAGPGVRVGVGPVAPPGPIPLSPRERKELINQRSVLMLWISRMQSAELKDPKSAAKTLAEALDYLEASKTEIDYVWLEIVKAYPLLLHKAGDVAGSVAAWKRCAATRRQSQHDYRDSQLVDVDRIHKALCSLPEEAERPEVPWIFFLGGDEPATKLDFGDAKTRARSYHPGTYDHYALAPPRGREFATIEFACDIEQFNARYGGQFGCFVMAHDPPDKPKDLGSIGWTNKQPGREVVQKTFTIPPGAGLVHIRIGTPKEFTVHSVSAKATFRPAAKDPPPIQADAWMQTKLYPSNGRLTWGPMTMQDDRAYSGVRPGRETLRFSAPGRNETIEMPFQVKPGRRYGLFINLDSPFRWQQLDLELTGSPAVNPPRFSIQRLGEEGHMAVWRAGDGKLLAARSKDLVHWTKPEPLPFSSVFDNIEPATFRAPDGTIYLAFFSNRLSPQTTSSAGYHLWLTRTRDGQVWAPIRRIEIGTLGGWPPSSPSMLVGPNGKHWIFWRDMAGSAETLDGVVEMTPIQVQGQGINGKTVNLWNVHVVVDDRKLFRMVCDDFGKAVYHLSSEDGYSWTRPQLLVEKKGSGPGPTDPQLILTGGKVLLLCGGAHLFRVDLTADPVPAGEGVKVSCHLASLAGARLFCRGDEVFVVAGTETTWLLRAKLKDLLAATTSQ